eukprot:sb/3468967/
MDKSHPLRYIVDGSTVGPLFSDPRFSDTPIYAHPDLVTKTLSPEDVTKSGSDCIWTTRQCFIAGNKSHDDFAEHRHHQAQINLFKVVFQTFLHYFKQINLSLMMSMFGEIVSDPDLVTSSGERVLVTKSGIVVEHAPCGHKVDRVTSNSKILNTIMLSFRSVLEQTSSRVLEQTCAALPLSHVTSTVRKAMVSISIAANQSTLVKRRAGDRTARSENAALYSRPMNAILSYLYTELQQRDNT